MTWTYVISNLMVCYRRGHFGGNTGAGGHLSCWSPKDSREGGSKIAERSGLEINVEESLAYSDL